MLMSIYNSGAQFSPDSLQGDRVRYSNEKRFQRNDTVWITSGICKVLRKELLTGQPLVTEQAGAHTSRNLLLTAAGDIGVQYFSRNGNADQPFLMSNQSGTANLHLSIVYKENLPFRFSLRYNQSKPFQLDNPWEIHLGFDNRGYRDLLSGQIKDKYRQEFERRQKQLQRSYNDVFAQYQTQKDILESPEYIQQAVEARFRQSAVTTPLPAISGLPSNIPFSQKLASELEAKASLMADSLKSKVAVPELNLHETLGKRRDSLLRRVKDMQDSLEKKKQDLQAGLDSVNQALSGIYSQDSLEKYARSKGIDANRKAKKMYRLIQHSDLRLGKFLVNHSEMTISGIFLHGAGLKLGADRFVQVTAGAYDFAFREMFRFQRDTADRKKPFVLAIKTGKTDGRNLRALNYYLGQKRNPGSTAFNTITGISYERRFFFSKKLKLDLELAKSNTRKISATDKSYGAVKDLVSTFNTRVFGGYGNLTAELPKTNTSVDIAYRYWGLQFDAFNGGMYYNPQHNLSTRVSQFFWKRKLTINAGFRHSDFRTYGVASNLNSKTNFLSLNSTLRIRKFPVLNLGYYPGSQLYRLGDNRFYEYYYYILNATASHYFQVRKLPVQTVLTWSKFDNRFSDSVITGPTSSVNLFTTTWLGKFSCQAGYSWQKAREIALSTWEGGLTYSGARLRIGGTFKWNQSREEGRPGYTATIGYVHPVIGSISFLADQSFLPDGLGAFIPVSTGQIQLLKPLKFRIWQKRD